MVSIAHPSRSKSSAATSSSTNPPVATQSRGRASSRDRERDRDRERERDRDSGKTPLRDSSTSASSSSSSPLSSSGIHRKKNRSGNSSSSRSSLLSSSSPSKTPLPGNSPKAFSSTNGKTGISHTGSGVGRVGGRVIKGVGVVWLSLYLSICLEESTRQMFISPSSIIPTRVRGILHILGTGKLDTQVSGLQQHQLISSSPPGPVLEEWYNLEGVIRETIPVVIVTSHIPNDPFHPAIHAIRQARKLNREVWVLGPNPNLKHLQALGVHIESRFSYNLTFNWLQTHLGIAKIEFARLWFLRAFMHRHKMRRVFSISADVMLYANMTELVSVLYPDSFVALPVRWPSMQPPPLPSQFISTSVSAHAGLWHVDALDDFLALYEVIIELALFGGPRGAPVGRKEYQEHIVLGWYTWSQCWTNRRLDPPCMAEPTVGISVKLGRWLARKTQYRPKYLVESLCQPRMCRNSTWSEEGLCVFDNSFSVASSKKFFRFRPKQGDKCPQSKLYEHFHAWMGQTPQKNVQFLAVNFQGVRRDYLKLEDSDPAKTWGSAVF